MSTDRVDDVRRNVLSIVGRLCPEVRLPQVLDIWVGLPEEIVAVLYPLAAQSLLAHLIKLADEGRAVGTTETGWARPRGG